MKKLFAVLWNGLRVLVGCGELTDEQFTFEGDPMGEFVPKGYGTAWVISLIAWTLVFWIFLGKEGFSPLWGFMVAFVHMLFASIFCNIFCSMRRQPWEWKKD